MFPASWINQALDWPDGQSRNLKRALPIPSPGGEGWGEGGRGTKIILDSHVRRWICKLSLVESSLWLVPDSATGRTLHPVVSSN